MKIRKAVPDDVKAIGAIYDDIHSGEEAGKSSIGWVRGVYPTEETARLAVERGDMFVLEEGGSIIGAAIINQQQVDAYKDGNWKFEAADDRVMVLHTLVISPKAAGRGWGSKFVGFYEDYALNNGCNFLRMDTNARNIAARNLYKRLGYEEIGIVFCVFNGISGVPLVLLEKYIN